MELKAHLPRAAGGKPVNDVDPHPTRHQRIEMREEGGTGRIRPTTTKIVRTRREFVTRQVAIEDLTRERLVDGVPVNLRDDAAFLDREQPPQLLGIRGVRVDVRRAGSPQCCEKRRGNQPHTLGCPARATAGHQDLFETCRDSIDGVLVARGHGVGQS
jgi:hypothetical protein